MPEDLRFVVADDPGSDHDLVQEVWRGDLLLADLRRVDGRWVVTFFATGTDRCALSASELRAIEREMSRFRLQGALALERTETGESFPIPPGGDVVIGRSPDANVHVAEPTLARRHAVVRERDGEVTIEDQQSSGGTFVNQRRADGPAVLVAGDVVRMGVIQMTVRRASELDGDAGWRRFLETFLPDGAPSAHALAYDLDAEHSFTPAPDRLRACLAEYVGRLEALPDERVMDVLSGYVLEASELVVAYVRRAGDPAPVDDAFRKRARAVIAAHLRRLEPFGTLARGDGVKRLHAICDLLEE